MAPDEALAPYEVLVPVEALAPVEMLGEAPGDALNEALDVYEMERRGQRADFVWAAS